MDPLVSVIVTTYRGTDTVKRAVESVLSQTYRNIEVIVVDDNGLKTEAQVATQAIVKEFHNQKIRYIAHPMNKNGSAARNTGIKAAKGEYIALLDDDDVFRKDKIERQVMALQEHGPEYAVCYTGMLIHFQDGREIESLQTFEGNIFPEIIGRQVEAPSSVLLFRKSAAIEIGCFDESFRRHQDWEFLDRMAYKFAVAVVPEICIDRYIYKRNSAKNPDQFAENRMFYLDKMQPYLMCLSEAQRFQIMDFHYQSISKEYLKAKKIKNMFIYINLCEHPIKMSLLTVKDAIKWLSSKFATKIKKRELFK